MKESVHPPHKSFSGLLRPEDKRLIWDKGLGQSSSRFTVHYDGRSVPRLTRLYICRGFMECVREEWCEQCAQEWHTHLGKWWNDGRRFPMCPIHKKCLLVIKRRRRATVLECHIHANIFTHRHTISWSVPPCPLCACWPDTPLLQHLLYSTAPHLYISKSICILRSPKHTHVNTDIIVAYQAEIISPQFRTSGYFISSGTHLQRAQAHKIPITANSNKYTNLSSVTG